MLWVPDHFINSSNSRFVLWLLRCNDIEKFLHLPGKTLLNGCIAVHEIPFHIHAAHLVIGQAGFQINHYAVERPVGVFAVVNEVHHLGGFIHQRAFGEMLMKRGGIQFGQQKLIGQLVECR